MAQMSKFGAMMDPHRSLMDPHLPKRSWEAVPSTGNLADQVIRSFHES